MLSTDCRCYGCQKKFKKKLMVDFPKNFLLINLAETPKTINPNQFTKCELSGMPEMYIEVSTFRFYCDNCKSSFCNDCVIVHSGHSFFELTHSIERMKEIARETSNKLSEQVQNLTKEIIIAEALVNNLRLEKEKGIEKIKEAVDLTRLAIDERESELIDLINYIASNKLDKWMERKTECSSLKPNILHQRSNISECKQKLSTIHH